MNAPAEPKKYGHIGLPRPASEYVTQLEEIFMGNVSIDSVVILHPAWAASEDLKKLWEIQTRIDAMGRKEFMKAAISTLLLEWNAVGAEDVKVANRRIAVMAAAIEENQSQKLAAFFSRATFKAMELHMSIISSKFPDADWTPFSDKTEMLSPALLSRIVSSVSGEERFAGKFIASARNMMERLKKRWNDPESEEKLENALKFAKSKSAEIELKAFVENKGAIVARLKEAVVGQESSIDGFFDALWIEKALSGVNKRPYVCVLAGPSGVGKTSFPEKLAKELWTEAAVVNLWNFFDAHTAATLLGSPPSYVGYSDKTVLEEYLSNIGGKIPVIVFDEIEKAHTGVHKLFLELFDKGTVSLLSGRSMNLSKAVVFLTTNVDSERRSIGFEEPSEKTGKIQDATALRENLGKTFAPEILNRIDDFFVFEELGPDSLEKILYGKVKAAIAEARDSLTLLSFGRTALEKLNADVMAKKITEKYGKIENVRKIEKICEREVLEQVLRTPNAATDKGSR